LSSNLNSPWKGNTSLFEVLTRQQFRILKLVASGRTNSQIARLLDINANSVGNHLIFIYRILEIPKSASQRVVAANLFHYFAGIVPNYENDCFE
jgi:DNA-binding NarL/FixJ family response regulator